MRSAAGHLISISIHYMYYKTNNFTGNWHTLRRVMLQLHAQQGTQWVGSPQALGTDTKIISSTQSPDRQRLFSCAGPPVPSPFLYVQLLLLLALNLGG